MTADLWKMSDRALMISDVLLTHYAIRLLDGSLEGCNCGWRNPDGTLDEHARHQAVRLDAALQPPYCDAQVGGMECGQPVKRWGQQCERHDPKTKWERYWWCFGPDGCWIETWDGEPSKDNVMKVGFIKDESGNGVECIAAAERVIAVLNRYSR